MRQEERRHHPASGQCRVDLAAHGFRVIMSNRRAAVVAPDWISSLGAEPSTATDAGALARGCPGRVDAPRLVRVAAGTGAPAASAMTSVPTCPGPSRMPRRGEAGWPGIAPDIPGGGHHPAIPGSSVTGAGAAGLAGTAATGTGRACCQVPALLLNRYPAAVKAAVRMPANQTTARPRWLPVGIPSSMARTASMAWDIG
jgi:hypothetical protein